MSSSAIHYAFKALGCTRKKNCTYYEQDSEKVAVFQTAFEKLCYLPTVYIDETGFNTYFYREYGRSLRGQIIEGQISGKKYQLISLVAGLVGEK